MHNLLRPADVLLSYTCAVIWGKVKPRRKWSNEHIHYGLKEYTSAHQGSFTPSEGKLETLTPAYCTTHFQDTCLQRTVIMFRTEIMLLLFRDFFSHGIIQVKPLWIHSHNTSLKSCNYIHYFCLVIPQLTSWAWMIIWKCKMKLNPLWPLGKQ